MNESINQYIHLSRVGEFRQRGVALQGWVPALGTLGQPPKARRGRAAGDRRGALLARLGPLLRAARTGRRLHPAAAATA